MTDEFYSGNWEGYYLYGEQYNAERRKARVGFYVKMTLRGGILHGTCEEFITKAYLHEPAILSGTIEGDNIRFVKQYPFFFEIDEQNNVIVNKAWSGPEVYYSGTFDGSTRTFVGTWGIEPVPGKDADAGPDDAYLYTGSWSMVKV